jgi:hypothetical protein
MTIRDSWPAGQDESVICIACGTEMRLSEACEYDKYGGQYHREDDCFQYLCESCFGVSHHLSRSGLEETLIEAGAGRVSDRIFLRRYFDLAGGESTRG